MEFAESLVVVASGYAIDDQTPLEVRQLVGAHLTRTVGTGILVQFRGNNFLMTCRHVWESIPSGEVPKALVVGKPTLYMANSLVYFHPKDTATETTDALFVCLGSGASMQFGLIALSVSDLYQPVPDGTPLEVWGYPQTNIMQGKEIAPQLKCVTAKAMNVPVRDSRPTNYGKTVKLQSSASIDADQDLAGLSGGLVLMIKNGKRYPLGMLTGAGTGYLLGSQVQMAVINYITFLDAIST